MSTMMRKRSRPFQKDSSFTSDNGVHKARGSPFFTVTGLFVGLSGKTTDSDSARSPTSPLDYRVFANLGSSFARSPRSLAGFDGVPKSWDSDRVGLGLVDSLNDGKVLGSSESRSILLGSQMRIQPTTPKTHLLNCPQDEGNDYVSRSSPKFEIGSIGDEKAPADSTGPSSFPQARVFKANSEGLLLKLESVLSGSLPIDIGKGNGVIGSLSASGIELSEDYTCIISHGPNPKTTHIFGDCILDGESIRSFDCKNHNKNGDMSLPSDDFLSYCFSCKRKLEQGEDIYIYGGDKAFCSGNCRDQEILSDEELEKPAADAASANCLGSASFHGEIFMALAS